MKTITQLISGFIFIFYLNLFAQNASLNELKINPVAKVTNYNRTHFNADPQFWDGCEDNDGYLIFGNNDGAVFFDGNQWSKINLPNNSSVRSLYKSSSGKIYAGGYNEFGTLQKDNKGKYYYHSLMNELHLTNKHIENIWQIHEFGDYIICRTFNGLIMVKGNTALFIPANESFLNSAVIHDTFYIQDNNYGIYHYNLKNKELNMVFSSNLFQNEEIASMLESENKEEILLFSKSGNIYKGNLKSFKVKKIASLFEATNPDQISKAILKDNSTILIGTLASKIIEFTIATGTINKNNPSYRNLKNVAIHNLFKSNSNYWIVTNNGLSFVDFNPSFINLFDKASVYDVLIHNSRIYLATNAGVYFADTSLNNSSNTYSSFQKINETQGQVWSIQLFENDIIISHNDGLFVLNDLKPKRIGDESGFWKITPIENNPGKYLASNYLGLFLLEKSNGDWKIRHKIDGFEESARDILASEEKNTFWICHGYQGVFKVHLNSSFTKAIAVEHFTDKNGLKSFYNVNVVKWDNQTLFTTNDGIYQYNLKQNKFVPFKKLNNVFDPTKNTRKLITQGSKTWFVLNDEAGYFYTNSEQKTLHKDLFLNLKGYFNRGMECIVPLSENQVLFGSNLGLFFYNLKTNSTKTKVPTQLTSVKFTADQIPFLANVTSEKAIEFPNKTAFLRFEFAAPQMTKNTNIQFSYQLEPIDKNWSNWQNSSYKEFTHLNAGNYTFKIKSRNLSGISGTETSYKFSILPKWYQTNIAFFLYISSLILFIYIIWVWLKKKIEKEKTKARIESDKTKKLLELELEQLKLLREKEKINAAKVHLEEDVIEKSKQLANYTLMLSQKKELFNELQFDLKSLREINKNDDFRKRISHIFQKLHQNKIGEEFMEIFDVNFEKVNHNFFEKLKEISPSITKRELRLCAFVKMDLSNKEIAPLLSISIRGVENARYRVRKKLNVQHEENFSAYLLNLVND